MIWHWVRSALAKQYVCGALDVCGALGSRVIAFGQFSREPRQSRGARN